MLLILFFIILLVLVLPFSETDVLDETGRTDSHDDVSTAPKSIRKKVAGNTSFNSVSRRRLAEGVTFASKLENLKHKAAKTVLVHMHIPKVPTCMSRLQSFIVMMYLSSSFIRGLLL
jgi:hypothetical protein